MSGHSEKHRYTRSSVQIPRNGIARSKGTHSSKTHECQIAIVLHSEEGAICWPFILKILPIEKNSLTVAQQETKERPLTTTLKILGMQSSIKQRSQAEVNLKHTWVASLQILHYAIVAFIPSTLVKVPGLKWLVSCFYCF